MSIIIHVVKFCASTFGTAIICIISYNFLCSDCNTPLLVLPGTRRTATSLAARREDILVPRRRRMPKENCEGIKCRGVQKFPNFLTWPSACSFSQKAAACRCRGTLRRRHASPRGCATSAASFRHRRSVSTSSTPTRARYRKLRGCYTRRSRRSSGSGE